MTVWAWLCLLVGFSVLWQPPVLWLPLLCSLFVPELWTISMKCSFCVTPALCALNKHLTQPHLTCKEVPIISYAPCSVQLVLKFCFIIKHYISISGLEKIQRPTNANSHMDFCWNSKVIRPQNKIKWSNYVLYSSFTFGLSAGRC